MSYNLQQTDQHINHKANLNVDKSASVRKLIYLRTLVEKQMRH
jgi:hypothetical protein